MKQIIFLLTIIVFSGESIYAQTKITGTVVDKENRPLMDVQVTSEKGDVAVTTDLDGRFEITVPEGSKLTFSMLGNKAKSVVAADGMVVVMGSGDNGKWDWRKQQWNNIIMAEYGYCSSVGLHSIGLRYGMCHYAGWFVGARFLSSNFAFPTVEYTMSGGRVEDPKTGSGIPMLNGCTNINQFTVSAGVLWRMYVPLYGYIGAGYGYRQTAYETTGGVWLYESNDKRSMATLEFGLIGDIHGFTLSAGCEVMFSGSTEIYPKIGIGYTFPMKK